MRSLLLLLLLLFSSTVVLVSCSGTNGNDSRTQLVPLETKAPPGPLDTISVTIQNYCPATGRSFKDLYAVNTSYQYYNNSLQLDSDYDGIPDVIENGPSKVTFNLSPSLYDTNNDLMTDLLMFKLGIYAVEQPLLSCADASDTDGDGIFFRNPKLPNSAPLQYFGFRNCEESMLLHTNPANFDTDSDGIPDLLEVRAGLNPLDANDALLDPDSDGLNNKSEVKFGTPINVNNEQGSIKNMQLNYTLEAQLTNPGCYKFTITNLPVMNGGQDNLLYFNFIENDTLNAPHLWTNHLVLPANSTGLNFNIIFNSANGGFTQR